MEKKHLRRLEDKFQEDIAEKTIVCLHIEDEYEFMQMELVDILESKVSEHLKGNR